MANPFDVYDEKPKSGNAFDKYDKGDKQSLLSDSAEGLKNLLYGTAKGFADPVYGISQLALHGANSVANSFGNGKPLQKLTDQYDAFLKANEDQYQSDTAGSIPAGVGRFGANMITPVKGAKGLTGLAAIVNGAKTGAGLSLVQPVYDTGGDYGDKKLTQMEVGTGLGAAFPVAGNALGAAWNSVKPAIMPRSVVAENLLRGAKNDASLNGGNSATKPSVIDQVKAGLTGKAPQPTIAVGAGNVGSLTGVRSADEVLDRINNRQQFVAGSQPTTAQVVNTPEIAMAEKVLMNNPAYRAAMENRANANNTARLDVISQVAKTPEDLQKAVDARTSATKPLYDSAFSQPYEINPELQAILERPSAQAAIARGRVIAAEQNKALGITPAVPEQTSFTTQKVLSGTDAAGMPVYKDVQIPSTTAATPGSIDGQTLQYLKLGIGGVIPDSRPNGVAGLSSDAIKKTSRDLHQWLLDNAPAYKQADAVYAQHSVPINDMRVGQEVKNALGLAPSLDNNLKTLNSAGDTGLTLNNVQSAIKKALSEEGDYGVSPDAEKLLQGLKMDLQRQSGGASSIRSTGSDSVYNLQAPNWLSGKLFGNDMSGSGNAVPAVIGGLAGVGDFLLGSGGLLSSGTVGTVASAVAKKGSQFIGNRVNSEFEKAMLDPDYYKTLLTEALKQKGGLLADSAPDIANGLSLTGLLNTR